MMTHKQKDILALVALAVLFVPAVLMALELPWPLWVLLPLLFTVSAIGLVNRLAELEGRQDWRTLAPDDPVFRRTACKGSVHIWIGTVPDEAAPGDRCDCGRWRYDQFDEMVMDALAQDVAERVLFGKRQ